MMDQLARLQRQLVNNEAQHHRERLQADRSIISAGDVGRQLKSSSAWTSSPNVSKLYHMLDVKETTLKTLVDNTLRTLPGSWEACAQLETLARAEDNSSNKKRQKPSSADSSVITTAHQTSSASLTESQVQLGWGYVLRQLQQVGGQYAQWHLQDTSVSGITGHSGKVDFCFFAAQHKA